MRLRAIDITLSAVFAALMAIGANITAFLVVGGVPITLTTFFCVLSGLVLGSRLGAISMSVYALVGLVGAPVFAKFMGGPAALISPTFGFILSYILIAYVVGKIVDAKASKKTYIIAALVGMTLNYVIGTNWMYFAYKFWASAPDAFSYELVWTWMMAPLPKDIVLSVFAGILAPRIQRSIAKNANHVGDQSVA
ncbi:biotin transporter BioY [Salinibacillus xinjiangensis]|uniref:Biotin transporter n=1 Tax=Salinibacillus xinjiangensis TaxID=1229268 RepID=A0A6G1X4A9_9BACI|nr:biotin transporter BioY [Salinibacillus xinjiangensis]MRG85782.1 ECF transporter S component [Salinibacillus xinjiangensis]